MKKVLSSLLILFLFFLSLSGCNVSVETDVWDGSVADSFAYGNGTEKDPFVIEKASQLAFLAQEVNDGKDYKGKYISLVCELDLNNCEWTPIGNGTHSFSGNFDGNDHSIFNLKITNGAYFVGEISSKEVSQYTTGLFGSIVDAVIKNINIDGAIISIQTTLDRNMITAGVLAGNIHSNTYTQISNVTISNATIKADFVQKNMPTTLSVGGMSGYLYGEEEAICQISHIQSDTYISIENGVGRDNRIGGLFGTFFVKMQGNVQDCASYLTIDLHKENCYLQDNYFGAFGYLSTRNIFSLLNVFSKITINKIQDYWGVYSAYTANAIAGFTGVAPISKNGGYQFENVFGFVEQIDPETNERATSVALHDISLECIYTETNCRGCEQLPSNHGFDNEVWNFDDPSAPRLK